MKRRVIIPGRRAFTLMEVLVVLALIGLLGGIVVVDFADQADRWSMPNDHESLHSAVMAARAAAPAGRVSVHYVESRGALVVRAEKELGSFPVKGRVRFALPEDEPGGTSRDLDRLVFSPQGDAVPALIIIEGAERSFSYRLEPFSGALSEEHP